jgi:hypothetical protein
MSKDEQPKSPSYSPLPLSVQRQLHTPPKRSWAWLGVLLVFALVAVVAVILGGIALSKSNKNQEAIATLQITDTPLPADTETPTPLPSPTELPTPSPTEPPPYIAHIYKEEPLAESYLHSSTPLAMIVQVNEGAGKVVQVAFTQGYGTLSDGTNALTRTAETTLEPSTMIVTLDAEGIGHLTFLAAAPSSDIEIQVSVQNEDGSYFVTDSLSFLTRRDNVKLEFNPSPLTISQPNTPQELKLLLTANTNASYPREYTLTLNADTPLEPVQFFADADGQVPYTPQNPITITTGQAISIFVSLPPILDPADVLSGLVTWSASIEGYPNAKAEAAINWAAPCYLINSSGGDITVIDQATGGRDKTIKPGEIMYPSHKNGDRYTVTLSTPLTSVPVETTLLVDVTPIGITVPLPLQAACDALPPA